MGANWSFVGSQFLAALSPTQSLCDWHENLPDTGVCFSQDGMLYLSRHSMVQADPKCRCDQHGRTTEPTFVWASDVGTKLSIRMQILFGGCNQAGWGESGVSKKMTVSWS